MTYKKIQANIDTDIATQAHDIFQDVGLTTTAAINLFYKKVVATGGIPFDLKQTPEQKASRQLAETVQKYIPEKKIHSQQEFEAWLNED